MKNPHAVLALFFQYLNTSLVKPESLLAHTLIPMKQSCFHMLHLHSSLEEVLIFPGGDLGLISHTDHTDTHRHDIEPVGRSYSEELALLGCRGKEEGHAGSYTRSAKAHLVSFEGFQVKWDAILVGSSPHCLGVLCTSESFEVQQALSASRMCLGFDEQLRRA